LAESLGGQPLPGIGFALGIDRIVLARDSSADARPALDVYVVTVGPDSAAAGFRLATTLRRAGLTADLDLAGRSLKGQMKQASDSGARWAAIVGAKEIAGGRVTVKDLATSEQRDVAVDDLIDVVRP
jgi:histidyl-tRNA synthetase